MTERYLEDFAVGQTYGSGRFQIDEKRIKSFASEFDPQPESRNTLNKPVQSLSGDGASRHVICGLLKKKSRIRI